MAEIKTEHGTWKRVAGGVVLVDAGGNAVAIDEKTRADGETLLAPLEAEEKAAKAAEKAAKAAALKAAEEAANAAPVSADAAPKGKKKAADVSDETP